MGDDVYRSAEYARQAKALSENSSKAEQIARLPRAEREALFADFSEAELEAFEYDLGEAVVTAEPTTTYRRLAHVAAACGTWVRQDAQGQDRLILDEMFIEDLSGRMPWLRILRMVSCSFLRTATICLAFSSSNRRFSSLTF